MSSGSLWLLKILAFAGIIVELGVIVVTLLAWLIWSLDPLTMWIYLWFEFSIGLPAFGILFVTVKNREYLKELASKS